MSTLTNYEGLLALSTSPHLSQVMREYLVGVLSEHRELRTVLSRIITEAGEGSRKGRAIDLLDRDTIEAAHAAIAKAGGKS